MIIIKQMSFENLIRIAQVTLELLKIYIHLLTGFGDFAPQSMQRKLRIILYLKFLNL